MDHKYAIKPGDLFVTDYCSCLAREKETFRQQYCNEHLVLILILDKKIQIGPSDDFKYRSCFKTFLKHKTLNKSYVTSHSEPYLINWTKKL